MVYGPFSLVDATAAEFNFKLWLSSELNYDELCRYASIDGTNFYVNYTTGNSSGWIDRVLDLTNVYTLGDLTGQLNVWVELLFDTDYSITKAEGAYADDIVLHKCTAVSCPSGSAALAAPGTHQIIDFPSAMTLQRE